VVTSLTPSHPIKGDTTCPATPKPTSGVCAKPGPDGTIAKAPSHPCRGNTWRTTSLCSFSDGDAQTPFTAARRGYSEIELYLEGLLNTFSMDHWRIDDTVAEGDKVVGIGSTGWTSKDTGKSFVTPIVIVTRWRNGMICEYGEYYDTAKIAAATIPD